jgi:trimeric autotransporter adhesin
MAVNKNFVVKNGFEVSTDLILANADTNKVGVGTTAPQYTLHVSGGIGATDFYLTGIGTFINELNVGLGGTVLTVLGIGNSIGIGTALPAFLLDVRSPVSTGQTALYIQGDVRITGDLVVEDDLVLDEVTTRNITVSNQATTLNLSATGIGTITTLNSTSGTITNLTSTNLTGTSGTITTFNSTSGTITNLTGTSGTITTLNSTNGTITNLNVTGISTLGTVKVSSGIITATSGIVTYYGDGQYLDLTNNPSTGIGIGTTGGLVGYGITFLDLKGAGVSTTQYNSNTGIATIFFEGGGGGGGSISISTTAPVSPGSGDLWYSPDYGRTFIYYDESVVGYGTDAFWVDAAPFNVGIITALTNVSFSPGSAISPSMFFIGDQQTGFFSPGTGQFTVVSSGSSVLNVNASGIRVTGIATFTNASGTVTIGIGTTALLVEGNARVTGILTVGSSSITLNGSTNIINVGTGLTLSSSGINVTGVITATSFFGDG